MFQRFIAVGRLGRDPEISSTPNGTKVATVSLATSEYVKGEERTEWHRVVVWDEKLIEVLERRAKKGTMIVVEGQVRTRRWQKEGREILSTEIVLDRFNSRLQVLAGAKAPEADSDEHGEREPVPDRIDAEMDFEDELPF
jgi:single-strand DNA-binding protein